MIKTPADFGLVAFFHTTDAPRQKLIYPGRGLRTISVGDVCYLEG